MPGPARLVVASSNPGKLREYQALAAGHPIVLQLFPDFDSLPQFEEIYLTFAENAAGKALHYSRHTSLPVIADDSGLVVPALGGAPGPKSARYAGAGASDADRVKKLLEELRGQSRDARSARFVCVQALAQAGKIIAVFSDFVEGVLLDAPRGTGGFGYDPLFLYEPLGKTFAEIPREQKNQFSHRGKSFRKLLAFLAS
ncbi:MAG: RdgB/HAM1 family non-canonical purine NTP pyrophosphatase [Acidobacteria bacterium]|nr:RdgB/HAM1 family non-canonical purine NTP pyrophosphatase [Acidobacteriota bacterium]MCL5287912.1 RdgB/HAM1 family non-canonical purine NTP pyrophosphatase [Acidobacteriota bacterium]